MINIRKQECKEWLEDYNECLHRQKQVCARLNMRHGCHGLNMVTIEILAVLISIMGIVQSVQRTRDYVVERERAKQGNMQ